MEPSEIFEGNEECHSSESGWTMYIGSPIQGGDDDDDDKDNDDEADDVYADKTDHANHEAVVDSDDSMASDASSGPSHQGRQFYGKMEVGHGIGTSHFKHVDEGEEEGDCFLDKKAKKSMEKQKLGTKKKEDKEKEQTMTFEAKEARTPRSGSKQSKSVRLGKRK